MVNSKNFKYLGGSETKVMAQYDNVLTREIEDKLAEYGDDFRRLFRYWLHTENGRITVHMSKLLNPQPNSEFSESVCRVLIKEKGNSIPLSLRKLDTSPEDQLPGSEYKYFLSASVSFKENVDLEKVTQTLETIKVIEDTYRNGLSKVRKQLVKGDLTLDEAFSIVLKE